jgi:hypothetical protein
VLYRKTDWILPSPPIIYLALQNNLPQTLYPYAVLTRLEKLYDPDFVDSLLNPSQN